MNGEGRGPIFIKERNAIYNEKLNAMYNFTLQNIYIDLYMQLVCR